MIKIAGLKKSYPLRRKKTIDVLKGVTFDCEPGIITGLLGVNGAGKTTILRTLSTALAADEGDAQVAGFDLFTEADQVRGQLGFLSASTRLHGKLTAREELASYGRYFRLPESNLQQLITIALDKMEIGHCADLRLDNLSMGQSQRVNLARVLLHDPSVLILDEPTTGLDVISARVFLNLMEDCRQQGKTILFSTHNMSEATQLCDQLVILHDGQIVATGSPAEIMQSQKSDNLETAFLKNISNDQGEFA